MKTIKNKRVNRYIGEDNRFEIIDILGQGGMGEVFKAYDSKLHELVAIKSINKKFNNNRAVIDIFLNEAKTSLKITHPNVIRVRDILFFEGSHYLIMQFVDGIDLKEWMRLHKDIKDRDAKKMYEFIRPVFEALDYAHQYTVHRDIKPANIMLDNENIYLMDFGIATVTKGSKITDVIKDSHKVVGTPAYMSPEQQKGLKDIDKRTDIYAMGIIYYELLTNQKPSKQDILLASYFNDSVNPQLDMIILKMLAFNQEDRYSSCSDIIRDMDALFIGKLDTKEIKIDTIKDDINQDRFTTVEEGNFYRGSGVESKIEVEKPRRKIYLDTYRISIYPVTNREYLEFLEKNGLDYKKEFKDIAKKRPNYPLTNISWDEAKAYCKWLGGSLPTEAQWEKASKGTRSRIYPWGNQFNDNYCNIENILGDSVSVDSFEDGISQYGCYQMSGNIWEWCLDDFDENFYKKRESKNLNPCCLTKSDTKVIRGGSYDFVKSSARSSYRYYAKRNHKDKTIGFRVVLNEIK
ncbi:MAG TPA: hypothetical protein ENK88_07370 [Campylobacterales bacterium]|nr:hypothetical protein [Campylobacterales bacterium]